MKEWIINSKSRSFFVVCLGAISGLAWGSVGRVSIPMQQFILLFFVLLSFLIIWWHYKIMRLLVFIFLFGVLGFVRSQLAFPAFTPTSLLAYHGQTVTIHAIISKPPDVRLDSVKYIVLAQTIATTQTTQIKTKGYIYMSMPLYPRYVYGDAVTIKCRLLSPNPFPDFRFDMYLANQGVFSLCQSSHVFVTSHGHGNWFFGWLFYLKDQIATKVVMLWHEPYASFMAGLLYGYRGGLGKLNTLFNRTGVTHIVAISGYNITLVATLLLLFCTYLWIPRKRAFWLVVSAIFLFVLFTGATSSAIRAGIMGTLVLLAAYLGRRSHIGNILILTVFLMALINPFVILWDAGFQLSFLATLGLIYLNPLIEPFFTWAPKRFAIHESLIITSSAIIATLPIMLYQFGQLSIVALVVNLLILWILPWIMALGFFAVVVSFIFFPIGQIISWIAWVGMAYIVAIVTWFGNLSFASVQFQLSLSMTISLYVLLFVLTMNVQRRRK